jgi:hypothetical protein
VCFRSVWPLFVALLSVENPRSYGKYIILHNMIIKDEHDIAENFRDPVEPEHDASMTQRFLTAH